MMIRPLLLLITLFAAACPGFGALGAGEESVAADQTRFRAERRVITARDYNVHEISRGDGTLIREYVSPAGNVFGVSWKGPTIPDLSQLLGSSFAEFRDRVPKGPAHRRAAVVRSGDLVVESTGHMRAFYGRAYLNSMLPSGVTQEVVQ
jgi:hypothetical protein